MAPSPWGPDYPYTRFGERFETEAARLVPEDWAGLFARAGARYVVLTSKHMDGFALWPSAHANPRQPGWGARQDLVGAVARASRARGLRLGLYYCGGFDVTFEDRVIRTLGDCALAVPQAEGCLLSPGVVAARNARGEVLFELVRVNQRAKL